jgi:hypothetical protein
MAIQRRQRLSKRCSRLESHWKFSSEPWVPNQRPSASSSSASVTFVYEAELHSRSDVMTLAHGLSLWLLFVTSVRIITDSSCSGNSMVRRIAMGSVVINPDFPGWSSLHPIEVSVTRLCAALVPRSADTKTTKGCSSR